MNLIFCPTAAQYDPMRCFLISVEMGDKQYMTFDLKAHSAQNREQWVTWACDLILWNCIPISWANILTVVEVTFTYFTPHTVCIGWILCAHNNFHTCTQFWQQTIEGKPQTCGVNWTKCTHTRGDCVFRHCRWVNGLNNAKYVYEKLVDQHRALDNYKSSGKKVPEDGWLGRRYLYFSEESFQRSRKELVERQRRKGERRRSQSDSEVTEQNRMDSSLVLSPRTDTGSPHSQMEFEVVEHSDMVIVEEITSNSSRGTSPATSIPSEEEAVDSPVVLHTQYKLRTGTIPDRAPLPSISTHHLHQRLRSRHNKEWHSKTFEAANTMNVITGLPYKSNNPLASYCECHAYAIEEPRAMLFPAKSPPRDPFSSCCERCRNKCRVVRDLSNIWTTPSYISRYQEFLSPSYMYKSCQIPSIYILGSSHHVLCWLCFVCPVIMYRSFTWQNSCLKCLSWFFF